MPLYVGEEPIGNVCQSSTELFSRFPQLEIKSRELASQPARSFQGEKVLYIGQCEYGTVYPKDTSVTVIGSDSATTCQFVVFRHTASGACSLAHLDGCAMQKALADMVKSLIVCSDGDDQSRIELYVIGGFLDKHNLSEDIFMQILNGVAYLSPTIELVSASVCALNDTIMNGNHTPKIYGIGVFVQSGQVVPAQQFQCHIPDEVLRHVALYDVQREVRKIYSSLSQELIVKPVDVYMSSKEARKRANLPDERILQLFSTSPHCEPDNFVQKLREVFVFLADNPKFYRKYFTRGKPRRFKRKDNGDWCLIDEGQNQPIEN